MAINFQIPENTPAQTQNGPRITVIGVGGAGGNAVNNMIQSSLEGVEFVVANTDAQALAQSHSDHRIQLGSQLTRGLGAGSKPEIGRNAAIESIEEIMEQIRGSNMIFITAGMGGGTGTGAAPIIAAAAREEGILTVGVVTKPFQFEGVHRMRLADAGIEEMQKYVDTLIVIPNQNLFRIATENTTFAEAFKMADEVLHSGVRGVTDLMVRPGMINLDFSDIKTVMMEMGKAMMGTGEAEGERRAIEAAEKAISNPLLDDSSMKGAKGVLINITGGMDISLFEVDEAVTRIRDEVDSDANIIFGTTLDEAFNGKMRVSVVSTGINANEAEMPKPQLLNTQTQAPLQQPMKAAAPQHSTDADMKTVASKILSMKSAATQPQQPQMPVERVVNEAPAAQPEAVQQSLAINAESVARRIQKTLNENVAEAAPVQERAPFIPPQATQTPQMEETRPVQNPFTAHQEKVAEEEKSVTRSLFDRVKGLSSRQTKEKETAEIHEISQPSFDETLSEHRSSVTSRTNEDDLLDIPAFLRRQAN